MNAVIKIFKLENVLFFLLLLAAVIAAAVSLILMEESGSTSVSALGEDATPVLVIDAGHGGEDGGAVSITGVHESVINLDIALKMAALSDLTGIEYTLTRDSEEITYPETAKTVASRKKYDQKQRVALVNETKNAVLISVHQNCYPHKSPYGPQAFYAKSEGSDELAELIQGTLNATLSPSNRRIASPVASNIYLYKNVKCTAVLVECGFISNPDESKLLESEGYRLKVAAVLTCAYLQYLDTKE